MKMILTMMFSFFGILLLSMNSTENRQLLVDSPRTRVKYGLDKLMKESEDGDKISIVSYKFYQEMLRGSEVICCNKSIKEKLLGLGLCELKDNKLVLFSYFISDDVAPLRRCAKFVA